MQVGVPASNPFLDISPVVRYWINTNILKDDHCRVTPYNAEENIVFTGPLKLNVEPKTATIKRQRYRDILYNEEWSNTGNFCLCHVIVDKIFNASALFTP